LSGWRAPCCCLLCCLSCCFSGLEQDSGIGGANELQGDSFPQVLCSTASAASASARVLCTVPAGWLGGE
jgi:hypothetical protein